MDKVDKIVADFSRRVRELREATGSSQEGFAYHAGIDRSYFGRIERGEANPTLRQIVAISETLGVPVDKLFKPARRKSG